MSTATLEHPAVALPTGFGPRATALRPAVSRPSTPSRGSGPRSPRPRAGHLRLVQGGAQTVAMPTAGSLHITRRGRLALTSSLTLVVALVLASVLGMLGPAGATTSVVVEPGMTLSQIAAEQLPDVPLSQAIVDLQRANQLSGTSVAAGQELVIPGR